MNGHKITRRSLLRSSAAAGTAALAAPWVVPSRVLGADAPSNRVAVAHVGVGGQGGGLLRGFLGQPLNQSVAVCDPIRQRRENAAALIERQYASQAASGQYKGCKAYNDFREVLARADIDAVVVATPDHWHVPIALQAVQAGKDIYVEKPLGTSIAQNKALREAVHRYNRIFQYGTQQRGFNTHCAYGCEVVRNGYIGELKEIHVVAPNGATGGKAQPQSVPEGMDYDMWLGPAPVTPYCHDRVIGGGRWHIYDYALGFIAGWGAHPLDIAHWGYPHIPVEYEGTGRIPTEGLFDTVVDWDVKGVYAGGVQFTLKPGGDKTTFVGTEGWIAPSRGGITASSPHLLKIQFKPGQIRLLQDNHHYRNFLTACLTRTTPAADIDSAVQSDFISHLGDLAIRSGRKIKWDPKTEQVVGDEEAARMLVRAMRSPWQV